MRNYHRWTEADDAILRARFAELIAAELAALIGVGIKQIYWRAHALGLRKTRDWVIERARLRSLQPGHGGSANWFKKGADPWNKGLSYTPGGRSGETRFRGGVRQGRAADLRPSGRGGCQDKPFYKRWRSEHLLIWEAAHGPLEKGKAIVFRGFRIFRWTARCAEQQMTD